VGDGTLLLSRHASQKTPYIGEPMPLLPLEYLNPPGNDLGVRLSLQELRGEKTRRRITSARYLTPDHTVAEFPGGLMGDTRYTYRIEFKGSPSFLPTTIRRVSSTGVELDTDEFRYRPVQCTAGTLYLPEWARLTDRTTDNRVALVSTWTAVLIQADVPIPTETFTIDFQMAKHVLNIDSFGPARLLPTASGAELRPTTTLIPTPVILGNPPGDAIGSLLPLLAGFFLLVVGLAVLVGSKRPKSGQP